MNRIAGAILMLAAAVAGHGVFVFLASHPEIHRYDVPANVARMVYLAIVAAVVLAAWGAMYLFSRNDR